MVAVKTCRPCERRLPSSSEFFSRSRQNKDGLDGHCKDCRREYKQNYRAQNRARLAAESRDWYEKNIDQARESRRMYDLEHKEERKQYMKKYQKDNNHKFADNTRNYRMRKTEAFDEDVNRLVVFQRDEGICGICGKEADVDNFHVDHIIPLSRGGRHSYDNVQVSHPSCNCAKRDHIMEKVA